MNLSVKIANIEFENPVTVASGTFGYTEPYCGAMDVKKLGGLILKTVTLRAQEGNPPPRIFETPAGMLNAIGIENIGADAFIAEKLPLLQKIGVPLIISILGHTDEEFVELAKKFNDADIAALELNLSCPNLKKNVLIAQDAQATARVIKKVKDISRYPVIPKLSPNVTDITEIALAAQDAGADAVNLINTLAGMAIDTKTRKPVLGNRTGGLSGPAIRPVALYMVYSVAQKVNIPIIATGGIMTTHDALEFLMAGAHLVSVGTANFIDPQTPLVILEGLKEYMAENKIAGVKELVGCAL